MSRDVYDHDEWAKGEIAQRRSTADADEEMGYRRAVANLVDPAHEQIDMLEPWPPRVVDGVVLTPAGRIAWHRERALLSPPCTPFTAARPRSAVQVTDLFCSTGDIRPRMAATSPRRPSWAQAMAFPPDFPDRIRPPVDLGSAVPPSVVEWMNPGQGRLAIRRAAARPLHPETVRRINHGLRRFFTGIYAGFGHLGGPDEPQEVAVR